jgi:hypothetical protein
MREKEVRGLMEAYSQVHAPQELTEEQVWEEVETWVNSLIEEGHDLSDYTWEEMYEAYIEEIYGTSLGGNTKTKPNKLDTAVGNVVKSITSSGADATPRTTGIYGQPTRKPAVAPAAKPTAPVAKPTAAKPTAPVAKPTAAKPTAPVAKPTAAKPTAPTATAKPTTPAKPAGSAMDQWAKANPKLAAAKAERDRTRGTSATTNPLMKDMKSRLPAPKSPAPPKGVNLASDVDLFDIVKGYLLDEGYAESEDAAMVIMVNMSEGWKESILESCGVELELDESQHARENPEEYERSSEAKEGRRKRSGINDPDTGINSDKFKAFMAKQMGGKKKKG